ncbi:NUDIX hydrolase [Oceanicoccus sagamiensis]|uniref:Coenzyme A pyrophosphatase n=1 Tax=Oceanicoccus sagamiensis TaxID=716816 RepID=A0A1X9NAK6_9GAMM|nr:CoA pyrophosphatase [Oceanicoccus sagamiensis]ARN73472.1 coenzyme A pyrophosphatase [Oceanicoccus sagamiensis]
MVITTLQQARQQLAPFKPRKKWYRRWVKRSAVALILRQTDSGLETLMIKRADREGDPWSGHMAFPGGRGEQADSNNLHTARRETWEEIGLDTDQHTQVLGRLSDIATPPFRGHHRMVVTPYLFTIEQVPELNPNHEVAEVIWVPLAFLADPDNRERMQWQRDNMTRDLPCYFYNDRRIWGLSLLMLDELVGLARYQ